MYEELAEDQSRFEERMEMTQTFTPPGMMPATQQVLLRVRVHGLALECGRASYRLGIIQPFATAGESYNVCSHLGIKVGGRFPATLQGYQRAGTDTHFVVSLAPQRDGTVELHTLHPCLCPPSIAPGKMDSARMQYTLPTASFKTMKLDKFSLEIYTDIIY